jgi:hypothetical protein
MIRILTFLVLTTWGRQCAAFLLLATALGTALVLDSAGPIGSEEPVVDPDVPLPVEGRIIYQGQPLGGALVSFLPVDNPGRHGAFGKTQPDGCLYLTTFAMGDGALPGEYKVVVRQIVPSPALEFERLGPAALLNPAYPETQSGFPLTWRASKSVLPAVYGSVTQSPLRCTVPAKANLVIELIQ